jgi:V/A-type H+-transporting ATPase subunit F
MGGGDTVLGFKALGLDIYPVSDGEEARLTLRRITQPEENYAVVYIEERIAQLLSPEIAKFNDKATPAIILIPGREGSMGLSLTALHDAVKRAIGADIL